MPMYGTFWYNRYQYNAAGYSFFDEIDKKRDIKPVVKVEFIDTTGTATDITKYYMGGGTVTRIKERAPDEIQAGDFDIVLANHDDYFSEFKSGSLLYETQYHNAKIRIWLGFVLPDGTTDSKIQVVGYIDELSANTKKSIITLRCRDIIKRILDEKIHPRPSAEIPVAGSNNGNGYVTKVDTRPFKTVNELWTLTCTTGGGDGTAEFSVVGATSGNVGTATSGTQFTTGTSAGGVRFTIYAGSTDWTIGDSFTFTTAQHPEWSLENPGKIIWSILTGYNWDSDTQEAWSDSVFDLDSTKASTNTDIDYDSFVDAIALFSASESLTGYAGYEEDPAEFMQGILIFSLGSLFTSNEGKIKLKINKPEFIVSRREYSDEKKITRFGYKRSINEVINYVSVKYKSTDSWEFDGDTETYDGAYVVENSTSSGKYHKLPYTWTAKWYGTNGNYVVNFANKLVNRYADPIVNFKITTLLDAIGAEIGDRIYLTDTKYGVSTVEAEISSITKKFDEEPMKIEMTVRQEEDLTITWGFLGSSADEGDGISPQAATYATANDIDKLFCYLGATGGSDPLYRMY